MSVRFVQLSKYASPSIFEDKRNDWVGYGEDNDYYQYLIDLYHNSPTNNSAIKGIADLVYGKGLEAVKADRNLEGYLMMLKLFKPSCVRKIVMDFKMLGQASFQLIKSKDGKKYVQASHWPIHTLRPEKMSEDGDIENYYYHPNWSEAEPNDEVKKIPAFGHDDGANICVYVIKPYSTGNEYFTPVDYTGGLQYAELESEVANYHLNNIKNGLTPTMIVNMNNGIPDERKQNQIENKLKDKFAGSSNAGKFILAFNDSKDAAATIEPVQLSDAHNQYQFLSSECMTKIMVAHRVTSPMLLGIKDNTGLGNNAEELKTASILFDNTVIRSMQETLLDAFKDVLYYNGYNIDIYFKTLQPLEFVDLSGQVLDDETREKETGVELSAHKHELNLDDVYEALSQVGEDEDLEAWDLVDERVVDYEQEEALDVMIQLASTGTARPNANSKQDGENKAGMHFRVRYQYQEDKQSPGKSGGSNTRDFCSKMLSANKVYRKEDILQLGSKAVNPGFGPNGTDTYSIWLYKGGPRCRHRWVRKTYRAKEPGLKADVNSPNAKVLTTPQARKEGFRPEANNNKVAVAPGNMKNKGFLNPKSAKDIKPGI